MPARHFVNLNIVGMAGTVLNRKVAHWQDCQHIGYDTITIYSSYVQKSVHYTIYIYIYDRFLYITDYIYGTDFWHIQHLQYIYIYISTFANRG